MRFERKLTNRTKNALKVILNCSLFLSGLAVCLFLLQDCVEIDGRVRLCSIFGLDSLIVLPIFALLAAISWIALLLTYIASIFVEGTEKPKLIHNDQTKKTDA